VGPLAAAVIAASATGALAQDETPAGPPTPEVPEAGVPAVPEVSGGAVASAPSGGQNREWTIVPGLTGSEQFTDNVNSTATGRQSDIISEITPSIYINGDTPRLQTTLNYTPDIIEHVTATNQNEVNQNLTGNGTLTAVPNLLFFDANAGMQNASRAGGLGFGDQAEIPSSLNTQTITYSGSPYLRFHFGDTGDEEVRYTYSEADFSGNTGNVTSPITGSSLGSLSNSRQHEILAKFVTGPALPRLQLTAENDFVDFQSTGSLSSHNETADVAGRYTVSGPFYALFDAGYDKLQYTQQNPLDYTGPQWSVGALFQPRVDRSVSLSYGTTDGQYGFSGNANYALTPLTTVTASYTHQTTTGQQQLLQSLAGLSSSAPGNAPNPTTGVTTPVQTPDQGLTGTSISQLSGLPTSLQNPNLALQNSTERLTTLNAAILMQGGQRNTYSLSVNRTESTTYTAGAVSQTSTGGYVTWNRDMSPRTNGILSAGYSTTNSGSGSASSGAVGTTTLSAGLNYTVSNKIGAAASYSLFREQGGVQGTVLVDLITLTVNVHF
jgi:uncharacterized protein (PEP-CTERM system associated)